MKNGTVDLFVKIISDKSQLQQKYLRDWRISDSEKKELENVLRFLMEKYKYALEFIADCYLFINTTSIEEQYYFIKNGRYRNTTFEEVNSQVYQNEEFMTKYMIGLTITDYIWEQHLKIIRYFEEKLPDYFSGGGYYLEIGPGFGQFLMRTVKTGRWRKYRAIDVSFVSVQKCRSYLEYCGMDKEEVTVEIQDFFKLDTEERFDNIVCGEVLEHVEDPLGMLQKVYLLLSSDGCAFITTVINAPAVDHIYLFSSIQEVLDMIEKAGFVIYDYTCAAEGRLTLEKAQKRKAAVSIALFAGRNNKENENKSYRLSG